MKTWEINSNGNLVLIDNKENKEYEIDFKVELNLSIKQRSFLFKSISKHTTETIEKIKQDIITHCK